MTDTLNEPVLPIPSQLSREITAVINEITVLRHKLVGLDRSFRTLQGWPCSVAVDDLGPATSVVEATSSVRGWLARADHPLDTAAQQLRHAHTHASRLKLTGAAADRALFPQ